MAEVGNNFTITWIPASGSAVTQKVQYKKSTDSSWTTYSTVSGSVGSATLTGLNPNILYNFRIVSVCNNGGPTNSNTYTLVRFSCPALSSTSTDSSISYSFPHPMGDISGITVDLMSNSGDSIISTQTPTAGSTLAGTFTGLTVNTLYRIRVNLSAGSYVSTCAPWPVSTTLVYGFVNIYRTNLWEYYGYTVKINDVEVTDLSDDYYLYFDSSHGNSVNVKIFLTAGVGEVDHDIYSAPNDAEEIQDSLLTKFDQRTNTNMLVEYNVATNVNNYIEVKGYEALPNITLTNTKDEDPHVDVLMVPLVNGINRGNIYASGSVQLTNLYANDTLSVFMNRSPGSVHWPIGSTARLALTNNGTTTYDSGNLYSATDEIANTSIVLESGRTYTVTTSSTGDSTNYLPVILTQINNSTAPLSTGKPTVVNFRITDNTNGEMVFDDGTYQQTQINGFNFLDTGGALAQQATLTITNNYSGALRFLIQNYDASATYWDMVVDPAETVVLPTLPKASVRITYTDVIPVP